MGGTPGQSTQLLPPVHNQWRGQQEGRRSLPSRLTDRLSTAAPPSPHLTTVEERSSRVTPSATFLSGSQRHRHFVTLHFFFTCSWTKCPLSVLMPHQRLHLPVGKPRWKRATFERLCTSPHPSTPPPPFPLFRLPATPLLSVCSSNHQSISQLLLLDSLLLWSICCRASVTADLSLPQARSSLVSHRDPKSNTHTLTLVFLLAKRSKKWCQSLIVNFYYTTRSFVS